MKKLTAGIFTVMLGLCAANNADAAVASKGYVDRFVGENGSITTEVATLKTTVADNKSAAEAAIADAKKAGTDAAAALETYKGTNDAAVEAAQAQADKGVSDAAVAKAVADGAVSVNTTQQAEIEKNADDINAINAELDTMATSETVTNLTTRVTTAEGKITTAEGEIDGLQASLAEGGATSNAIADAKQAGTEAAAALESYKTTNDAAVSANTSAISAINNAETGILAEAKKYADAKEADVNGALANYELKANLKALAYKATVGTDDIDNGAVTTAKLEDGAVDASKLGKDAVTDDAVANGALSQSKINGLDTTLAAKLNIPTVVNETDGKYVLTATSVNGQVTYYWESIER